MDIFYSLNIEAAASLELSRTNWEHHYTSWFCLLLGGNGEIRFLARCEAAVLFYIPGMYIGALAFYGACNSFQGASSNRVSIRVIVQRKTH